MKKLLFLIAIVFVASCSSIDCPLENMVATRYRFFDAKGDSVKLMDSLTVMTARSNGRDTMLLNKATEIFSFRLPISNQHPEDFFVFRFESKTAKASDTVWVEKDDIPHFESVDCSAKFFHNLKKVRYTTHVLDSIVIKNAFVDFNPTTIHFYVYPKISN